jgi:hypothetical protein
VHLGRLALAPRGLDPRERKSELPAPPGASSLHGVF